MLPERTGGALLVAVVAVVWTVEVMSVSFVAW
jgi:hypothetical protein